LDKLLQILNLEARHIRRQHSDAPFLINVSNNEKCSPPPGSTDSRFLCSRSEQTQLLLLFLSHCPSGRWASAAAAVADVFCKSVYILET
jgi:hypothetical protein